jgi:maltose alpha-D-glucosyltransferase/alpha-amylase
VRKQHPVFGRGSIRFLQAENKAVLSYLREDQRETVLVVNNLSLRPQPVLLDLSAFEGWVPVELFGGQEFPPIRREPYFFSLGSYDFFWFQLRPASPGGSR